jgi:hypothetical protein
LKQQNKQMRSNLTAITIQKTSEFKIEEVSSVMRTSSLLQDATASYSISFVKVHAMSFI